MPTSGVSFIPVTAREIIKSAFMLINVVPATQLVRPEDEAAAIVTLNDMLNNWMMDGTYPWRKQSGVLPLAAGQAEYTLTRPLGLISTQYASDSSGCCEVNLYQVEHDEYHDLPCKDTEGCPTQVYYQRNRDSGTLFVWPVPNNATDPGEIRYTYERGSELVTDATEEVDIPQEWNLTVKYNLAALLSDSYGGDTGIVARVEARAARLYDEAKMYERQGSVFMFPEEDYYL